MGVCCNPNTATKMCVCLQCQASNNFSAPDCAFSLSLASNRSPFDLSLLFFSSSFWAFLGFPLLQYLASKFNLRFVCYSPAHVIDNLHRNQLLSYELPPLYANSQFPSRTFRITIIHWRLYHGRLLVPLHAIFLPPIYPFSAATSHSVIFYLSPLDSALRPLTFISP